jgi:hypothetical protein
MSNTDWWIPRPGTCFIRRQLKLTPPNFICKCEEWTGIVLENLTYDAGRPMSVLTLRDDTGEQIEIRQDHWNILISHQWPIDSIEILWVPNV